MRYKFEQNEVENFQLNESALITRIIEWWKKHGRDYPWRNTADPYKIFVAEYMLQRTTPGHVLKVYEDFLTRYPTLTNAAAALESEFEKVLYPLGMKHRVALFKKSFEKLVEECGDFIPKDLDTLLKLPGVGPYTARAVMCFAFGKDLALLDVNIMRVLGRVLNIKSVKKRPHTDKDFWKRIDSLVPEGKGRDFSLALIDLAALICRRKKPSCEACPVGNWCFYYGREV